MAKKTAIEAGFYNGRFLTAGEVYEDGKGEDVDKRPAAPFIPSDSSVAADMVQVHPVDISAIVDAVPPLIEPAAASAVPPVSKK